MTTNEITEAIIGAAIEVQRALGPELLESDHLSHSITAVTQSTQRACQPPISSLRPENTLT